MYIYIYLKNHQFQTVWYFLEAKQISPLKSYPVAQKESNYLPTIHFSGGELLNFQGVAVVSPPGQSKMGQRTFFLEKRIIES